MNSNILYLEKTFKTPFVNFNGNTGNLEIKGISIPEDSIEFYSPILEWLEYYIQKPSAITYLKIDLNYLNTSSSKCIFDIILKVEKIVKNGLGKVTIDWFHEDDDISMIDTGEAYKMSISVPFNLVPYADNQ